MDNFVTWSMNNYLQLSVTETKEMRRTPNHVTPVTIHGATVDMVVVLGSFWIINQTGPEQVTHVFKKGLSCLHFLRQLRSFNICGTKLRTFYETVEAKAIMNASSAVAED